MVTGDCYQYDPNQSNSGCGVSDQDANVYGSGFNNNGGGVYAMEWTSSSIKAWFWPRNAIPGDVSSGSPNPSSWGTPFANQADNCDISTHFAQHNMVFDTTFCGDWAGSVFASDPVCGSQAGGNCQTYVASNPGAFQDAYWAINYVSVYQSPGEGNGGLGSYSSPLQTAEDVPVRNLTPPAVPDPAKASGIANDAQGGSTASVPGVTAPPKVAPKKLDQVPATANATSASLQAKRLASTLVA